MPKVPEYLKVAHARKAEPRGRRQVVCNGRNALRAVTKHRESTGRPKDWHAFNARRFFSCVS